MNWAPKPGMFVPQIDDVIIFRLKPQEMSGERYAEVMRKIAGMCNPSSDDRCYQVVMVFPMGKGRYSNMFVHDFAGTRSMLPRDEDLIEDIVLSIPEIESYKFRREYDMMDIYKSERRKSGMKAPIKKPTPFPHPTFPSYDMNEISAHRMHLLDEPALAEGRRFAALLKGYPFKDKTPKENRRWIEFEVIERLRALFPILYDADNRVLAGSPLSKVLHKIADERYQARLSADELSSLRTCFTGRHPHTIESALVNVTNRIVMEDIIAEKKAKQRPPRPEFATVHYEGDVIDKYFVSVSSFVNEPQSDLDFLDSDFDEND